MNPTELQKNVEKYGPAIGLDGVMSREVRYFIKMFFFYMTLILASFVIISFSNTVPYVEVIKGTFLIFSGIFLFLFCIDSFYYDIYFNDLPILNTEPHFKNPDMAGTFIVAKIMGKTENSDVAIGLLSSPHGIGLARRLDIPLSDIKEFISNKQNKINLSEFEVEIQNSNNLFESYVGSLFNKDKEFHDFVFKYSVKEKELGEAARWMTKKYESDKKDLRWYGRDNFKKVEGIGKDWSYGTAFALEKYAGRIENLYDFTSVGLGKHEKEIGEIESALSRGNEENVMLVADDEPQQIDVLVELSKKIYSGKVPTLLNRAIYILDINNIIVGKKTKVDFEKEVVDVFNGAERAGNVILVIKDLIRATINCKSLDSDLIGLIIPYLNSNSFQILVLCDTNNFHESIENNMTLMDKFEVIHLPEDNEESLISNLEERTDYFEKIYNVFFTYQSLVAIAESASRYFTGQNISDKCIDMLTELPQFVLKQGRNTITKKDVMDMTQVKTGVPVGEIKQDEKDKLLNLENILHEKIISQNEAITAIGSAMRRARSGIESENRPMGSFLFLGPTGVGKTETCKVLSEVFFGKDKKILRLDMSEYNGPDSVSRLIGSFELGKQGVLSTMLRENQYGVLLLDEFEKANGEVHNLFLQILDEGFFSDMTGKKVNARNLIIIATSNAGSNIIWDYVKQGKILADNKQNIIDEIIHAGSFKPELMNRFDGVILFHPLSDSDLKQIATLMLKSLEKRLEQKGLELNITDDLINFLVEKGSDPVFGARPINRAIQDNVEEIISRKIISGEVKPGSKVTITKEELTH